MRAANGRLPSKAPYDRLDGANRRQMLISAIVEITTVTNSLDNGTWKPCRESAPAPIGSMVAFIQPFSRPAISSAARCGGRGRHVAVSRIQRPGGTALMVLSLG